MNVARILYPVQVLGPGNRIGIWVCGCARGCKGCSNPELWTAHPEYEISPDDVFSLIQKVSASHPVDGFTITGGEPMDQSKEIAKLIKLIFPVSEDILIYTGYRLEELKARNDSCTNFILEHTAVLIDGAYIEELNDNSPLRGSSNQKVHILNDRFNDRYQKFFDEAHNHIQNFTTADGLVSVGIHRPTF